MPLFSQQRPFSMRRRLKSASRRTFLVYPPRIIALELLIRSRDLQFVIGGLPCSPWVMPGIG